MNLMTDDEYHFENEYVDEAMLNSKANAILGDEIDMTSSQKRSRKENNSRREIKCIECEVNNLLYHSGLCKLYNLLYFYTNLIDCSTKQRPLARSYFTSERLILPLLDWSVQFVYGIFNCLWSR